jgi:hypothetical protein
MITDITAQIGTAKNTPTKLNKLPPSNTKKTIHTGLTPILLPIQRGPMMLSSVLPAKNTAATNKSPFSAWCWSRATTNAATNH